MVYYLSLMKTLYLLFLLPGLAFGQWTNNPGTPLRVCPTESAQYGPWIFSDGDGGQFLFWTDTRGGGSVGNSLKLFAQRLDQNGNRLFPDSGKLIVHRPGLKTIDYAIAQDDQKNFWISWGLSTSTRLDSIVINRFNKTTLNPIWAKTKTIAKISGSFNVLYLESMRILPVGDSANLLYHVIWMGGSTAKFINRIGQNGNVVFGNGKTFSGYNQNYGPSTALVNPDGTFLLIQRNANALGTGVSAWKFDKKLNLNWGPKELTSGTPGLGYDFEVLPDGSNGFIMSWVREGNDIMATRVDSAGNFVWTPSHKPICDYSSSQDRPDLLLKDNFLYCVWSDNRPPANNADIYMQKLDLQGNRLWNQNGRRVFRLNSYIPVPKVFPASDGNLIVTAHHSSTGFVAQKVSPDSSLMWPGYGLLIASGNSLVPFYGSYGLSPGLNGHVFVAWQGSSTTRIFISGFASNGTLITENAALSAVKVGLRVFPNPGSGEAEIETNDGARIENIRIQSLAGAVVYQQVFTENTSRIKLTRLSIPAGIYWIEAQTRQGVFRTKWVRE